MAGNSIIVTTIAAQHDNLGDIIIRKKMLQWLDRQPTDVYVYVGDMPRGYLECFPSGESYHYFSSGFSLFTKVMREAVAGRRKVHLVLPPGPAGGRSSLYGLAKVASNYVMYFLCAATGGGLHSIGRAYRAKGWLGYLIKKLALRSQTLVVRDVVANSFVEGKARVEPDLGFELERCHEEDRKLVSICIRVMPGLTARSFEPLIAASINAGLKPCFVVQVKRDNEVAAAMANKLGVDASLWEEGVTHKERMKEISIVYSKSVLVVGNRLHGLILGMNNGAVPVALLAPGSDKLMSTLSVVMDEVDAITHDNMLAHDALGYWKECLRTSAIKKNIVIASIKNSVLRLEKVKNEFIGKL